MNARFNEGYFFLVVAIELVLVTVLAIALTYIAEQMGPVPRAVVVLTERLELVPFCRCRCNCCCSATNGKRSTANTNKKVNCICYMTMLLYTSKF